MDAPTDVDGCGGWDSGDCRGTPHCPPRCPRFVDSRGTALLFRPVDDSLPDREALLDLYDCEEARSARSYPPYGTHRSIATWLARLLDRSWNVVAFDGPRPVGHAVLAPSDAAEPEFGVFVDPDYRGRGIASELLCQSIAHAAARGCDGIEMVVERGNRAMRAVASGHGFEAVESPDGDGWIGFVSFRLSFDGWPERSGLVSVPE